MGNERISKMKMIRSTSHVLGEFRKNPSKVFFDTLEITIDNAYVYRVSKKQVLSYLSKKVVELEKKINETN